MEVVKIIKNNDDKKYYVYVDNTIISIQGNLTTACKKLHSYVKSQS